MSTSRVTAGPYSRKSLRCLAMRPLSRASIAILSQAGQVLDFTRPVAVTLLAVLHAIPDSDDPHAIVARLMDAVPSGSYLAISHAGSDLFDREALDGLEEITVQMVRLEPAFRSREQVARFFDGTDLVEPGLVRVEEWRSESSAATTGRSSLWWRPETLMPAAQRCHRCEIRARWGNQPRPFRIKIKQQPGARSRSRRRRRGCHKEAA